MYIYCIIHQKVAPETFIFAIIRPRRTISKIQEWINFNCRFSEVDLIGPDLIKGSVYPWGQGFRIQRRGNLEDDRIKFNPRHMGTQNNFNL